MGRRWTFGVLRCGMLLGAVPLAAQTARNAGSNPVVARLEQRIPQLMREGDVPGLSIAVVQGGREVWRHGYGVMDVASGQPVSDSTVFEAASLTKPVFAYAVLRLVDRGVLSLDQPLSGYLPEPYLKDDPRVDQITARMVLTHSTGFPNWRPGGGALQIYFTPGERFSYSGEGFVYLQRVVEQVTGQALQTVMQQEVFTPLGMSSSSMVWQDRYATLKATAHNASGSPTSQRRPSEANAAASLQTTAADYSRFIVAIIKGTGLKPATAKEMLHSQMRVDEGCSNCVGNRGASGRLSESVSWGLGWGLQRTGAGESFWHWGDNNGDVHCYVVASRAKQAGVVVFTNSGNGHSIIPDIVTEVMGPEQPATQWIRYERYDSPAKRLYQGILVGGMTAVEAYRGERTQRSGAEAIGEQGINSVGYWLLGKKRVKEAIEVFKLNVEDYPQSSNTSDSLGEAYMVDGDKELAIKNYEKSIELDPANGNGKAMLKRLKGE